ncbi:hypothetical protein [Nostoc sp. UHCC 0302]|uniref:hypothetical protein n=1 Tax=Nostoc sp. UHCC 0302 TaxID=3134896 RepID=UPI00311CD369
MCSSEFCSQVTKQYRDTGNVAPRKFNEGVKLRLTPEKLEILADIIENNNHATLDELYQLLQEKIGISFWG